MLNRVKKNRFEECHVAEKLFTLIFTILFTTLVNITYCQNTWTQKANCGGGIRDGATGFSIGNKGYIGTGYDGSFKIDFWEYDPVTDVWTQKANFGGVGRETAVGFSIGSKGYIGTGYLLTYPYALKDFWEYNPETNVWIQVADFGGTARWAGVGFSIGNKGYIGTGYATDGIKSDFWEYDPTLDIWDQKADFPGTRRYWATAFSIGRKGYIGTGINFDPDLVYYKDFWEYDQASNIWTQKANFGGTGRYGASGFSIDGKGYVGMGIKYDPDIINYKDFWEYDTDVNNWIEKTDFGGTARYAAAGFSIGNKGYIGTGSFTNDFWEYTPGTTTSTCSILTVLSTDNITSTTSNLKWDAVSGAIGYKVRYKIAGTPEWTTIQSIDNDKTLHELSPNTEYAWQVKSICSVLPIVSSEWSEKQFFTTDDLRLSEATVHETMEVYPNPVSQSATISFFLNEGSPVVIELMNVNGRSMRILADADFSEGNHDVTFNRESLNAGIYFLQMKTNEGVMMKKMVVE